MGRNAYLSYGDSRWTLSIDGAYSSFQVFDEAFAQACERLSQEGGVVYVSDGPGAAAGHFRVERRTAPPPTPPATPIASPSPSPVASPPRVAEAPGIGVEIAALRASYEQAREEIKSFPSQVERDIGLGTLRLEATHTLERLREDPRQLSEEELRPLSSYVRDLGDGKVTENAVRAFDKGVEKVLRSVGKSLLGLKLTGLASVLVGALLAFSDFSVSLGVGLVKGLIAGTVAVIAVIRIMQFGPEVTERAFNSSTRWAERLGTDAEQAMAEPRQIEQRLLASAPDARPWNYSSLASRARSRAEATIYICWGVIALGFAGMVLGIAQALGLTSS